AVRGSLPRRTDHPAGDARAGDRRARPPAGASQGWSGGAGLRSGGQMKRGPIAAAVVLVALSGGCRKAPPASPYLAVAVEPRDIVVSAQAAGTIQPDTTVEVKSKASGEVLRLGAETGQIVKRGAPLVNIDPRNARN